MAKRQKDILIRLIPGALDTVIVFMDAESVDKVKAIKGVDSVVADGDGDNRYYVEFDPRYDRKELWNEIQNIKGA